MSAPRRIAIVIDARDPAVVAEAWRAAVGVSLRGARVIVATVEGSADGGAAAVRARATLALFGHTVDADPRALEADLIECWRGPDSGSDSGSGSDSDSGSDSGSDSDSDSGSGTLHLVRAGRHPIAVAPGDRVLRLSPDVDPGRVLDALAASRCAVVW